MEKKSLKVRFDEFSEIYCQAMDLATEIMRYVLRERAMVTQEELRCLYDSLSEKNAVPSDIRNKMLRLNELTFQYRSEPEFFPFMIQICQRIEWIDTESEDLFAVAGMEKLSTEYILEFFERRNQFNKKVCLSSYQYLRVLARKMILRTVRRIILMASLVLFTCYYVVPKFF